MLKIKNNFKKILLSIFATASFLSCDNVGDIDTGKTTTGDFAGDWYIDLKDQTGASIASHAAHSTYNTSANDNTMWIDDHKHGYWVKCKITMDVENGTFSGVSQNNLNDPGSTVVITEGRITKGGALSKAGHVVDKIYFKAHFSYDPPATIIEHTGHKRTGFKEDEY